jgi:hypothetical protein
MLNGSYQFSLVSDARAGHAFGGPTTALSGFLLFQIL